MRVLVHPVAALAIRRGALAVVATLVTLAAHIGGGGGIAVSSPAMTAVAVGAIGLTALLVGRRLGPFTPRRPITTFTILLLLQVLAHALMWYAPWAVGLQAHHDGPAITPLMVTMHVVATLVLLPAVARMERILATASRAVRRLRRLLARRTAGAAWFGAPSSILGRLTVGPDVWRVAARGPPVEGIPRS